MVTPLRPLDAEPLVRALLAAMHDPVLVVGLDRQILTASEQAVGLLGYTLDEFAGLSLTALKVSPENTGQLQVIQRTLAGENPPPDRWVVRRKHGSEIVCDVTLSLVRDADHAPLYLLAVLREVGDSETQAHGQIDSETVRRFANLGDMFPGIIHILDLVENRTVYVNHKLIDLLGYPTSVPDGILNRLFTTLTHPDDRIRLRLDYARLRRAADHEVIEGEYRVRTANQEWRWLYSRSSVFTRDAEGQPRQIISVLIDIDDRKHEAVRQWTEQERVRLINTIATAAISDLDDKALSSTIVNAVHEHFPFFRVALADIDDAGMIHVQQSAQPDSMESLTGKSFSVRDVSFYERWRTTFEPLILNHLPETGTTPPVNIAQTGRAIDVRAVINMPLRHADQLIGLLIFHAPESHDWNEHEIETARECAAYISVALWSAEQRRVRQQTEAALQESQRQYRTLIDHLPDSAVLLIDRDLHFIVAGGTALSGVGLTRERLEGKCLTDVFPASVVELLRPHYQRALSGESSRFETEWNGHHYATDVLPVVDADGQIFTALSVISDMTERRHAEEARRVSEERYRQVVEEQSELISRFGPNGVLTFVNEAYCRYFGVQREDLLGQSFFSHVLEEDRPLIEQKLESMGPNKRVVRLTQRSVLPDGSLRWQEWVNQVILDANGNVAEYQGVGRDVTEQREAEAALAEKHHLLQTVIDSLPDFIYVKDLKGRYLLDNIPHARSVGETPEATIGKTDFDLFPRAMAADFARDDFQVIETGVPLINRDEISLNAAREPMWAVTSKVPFRNSRGDIIGLIGQTHDISARKAAEAELQRERDFTRTILDTTAALMVVAEPDGRIITFNHACERLSGYRAAEVIGRPFWDIFLLPEEQSGVRAAFAQLNSGSLINHNTNHWRVRDGRHVLIEWTNTAIMNDDGSVHYMISSGIDITERKQLEERNVELAVERERIRFLNDFVRNVSHDLRTPLSVLNTSLYLMRKVTDPARQLERIESMKEQVDRLTRLIEQLLTMSRLDNSDEMDRLPVDLVSVAQGVVQSFEPLARKRSLTLDVHMEDKSLDVVGDEGHLTIALSNLLENEMQYARTRIGLHAFRSQAGIVVEVSDDGPGLPADEVPHIFERFYRADKARSTETGGTGLGLSIARKIVDAHGGTITVDTTLGEGTLFRLRLPPAPSAD